MPELPDVLLYIEVLKPRILHQTLERVRLVPIMNLESLGLRFLAQGS